MNKIFNYENLLADGKKTLKDMESFISYPYPWAIASATAYVSSLIFLVYMFVFSFGYIILSIGFLAIGIFLTCAALDIHKLTKDAYRWENQDRTPKWCPWTTALVRKYKREGGRKK